MLIYPKKAHNIMKYFFCAPSINMGIYTLCVCVYACMCMCVCFCLFVQREVNKLYIIYIII